MKDVTKLQKDLLNQVAHLKFLAEKVPLPSKK